MLLKNLHIKINKTTIGTMKISNMNIFAKKTNISNKNCGFKPNKRPSELKQII